jgi:hypothetical protein
VQCPHSWRGLRSTTPRHHATPAGQRDLEPQRIGDLLLKWMLGCRFTVRLYSWRQTLTADSIRIRAAIAGPVSADVQEQGFRLLGLRSQ